MDNKVFNQMEEFDKYVNKLTIRFSISPEEAHTLMSNKFKQFRSNKIKKIKLAKLKNPMKEIYKHIKKSLEI